jgi:alkanesulfonate monooxygenase SsuD/methylene tetrahydromethanopterin reductase-like flavin-dependent oxidoreductase (luciferase family)
LCNQFRHPAVLAKMATTLDQVSAGRLDLGIGSGSIEDEHHRLGLDWEPSPGVPSAWPRRWRS